MYKPVSYLAQTFRESKNLFRASGAVVLLSSVASCVHAEATAPMSSEKVSAGLSFGWVDCVRPDEPYFIVSSHADGTYRYIGNAGVREVGTHDGLLQKKQLGNLMSAARELKRARSGKKPSAPDSAVGEELTSHYCLSVQQATPDGEKKTVVNFASAAAVRFNDNANVQTDFRARVCPGRGFNFYGNTGACKASDLTMIYDETGDCGVRHIVRLYLDGLVHYHAAGVSDSDQYATVSKVIASDLFQRAKGYMVTGSEGIEGSEISSRGKEVDLQEYRNLITRFTGIKFRDAGVGGRECFQKLEPSQLQRAITF